MSASNMSPMEVVQHADALNMRALLLDLPGDDVAMWLHGAHTWLSGSDTSGNITMIVPKDADFYATSLNIFLASRTVDQTDENSTSSDLTFRPAAWVTINNSEATQEAVFVVQDANATFSISDTYNGAYQGGSAMQVAAAYSGQYGQGSVRNQVPLSAWPGARKFHLPYKIKRGHTITVQIQPTFSRQPSASDDLLVTEFRATAIMNGHKTVRRA